MTATTTAPPPQPQGIFERAADFMSNAVGTPPAFVGAMSIVLVWALLGPAAGFSNTWQLIINTGTTIVTFLMVFLLSNASNRITDSQERMLAGISDEQRQLDTEERMVQTLLERIDLEHIRPILAHLDQQDHQLEAIAEKILASVRSPGAAGG